MSLSAVIMFGFAAFSVAFDITSGKSPPSGPKGCKRGIKVEFFFTPSQAVDFVHALLAPEQGFLQFFYFSETMEQARKRAVRSQYDYVSLVEMDPQVHSFLVQTGMMQVPPPQTSGTQPSKSVVVSDPSPASSSSATQNIQSAKPVELNSEEEKDERSLISRMEEGSRHSTFYAVQDYSYYQAAANREKFVQGLLCQTDGSLDVLKKISKKLKSVYFENAYVQNLKGNKIRVHLGEFFNRLADSIHQLKDTAELEAPGSRVRLPQERPLEIPEREVLVAASLCLLAREVAMKLRNKFGGVQPPSRSGDIDQEKRWHYYETLRRVYQDAFHNMQHQQYVEYVGDFGDTAQLPFVQSLRFYRRRNNIWPKQPSNFDIYPNINWLEDWLIRENDICSLFGIVIKIKPNDDAQIRAVEKIGEKADLSSVDFVNGLWKPMLRGESTSRGVVNEKRKILTWNPLTIRGRD